MNKHGSVSEITKSYIRTRSQTVKENEKIIKDYELQFREYEKEKKQHISVIEDLRRKLSERENLNNLLLKEQEENSNEYELICKTNQELKNKLAKEEIKNTELHSALLNVTITNKTILEDQDSINNFQNSYISPLKNEMCQISKEKKVIQLKYNQLLKKHKELVNIKMRTRKNRLIKQKIKKRSQKRVKQVIKNGKLLISKMRAENTKIKDDLLKLINEHQKKASEYDVNKSTLEKRIFQLEQLIKQNEESNKLDSINYYKKINPSNIKILDKTVLEGTQETCHFNETNANHRIDIVGDGLAKGLGMMMSNMLDKSYEICCYTYLNAEPTVIINKAEHLIKQDSTKLRTLVILMKYSEGKLTKNLVDNIKKLQSLTNKYGVNLIFSNVPYLETYNGHTKEINRIIYSINTKLHSMSTYDNMTQIIDLNLKTFKQSSYGYKKKLICHFVHQFCKNQERKSINTNVSRKEYENYPQVFWTGHVKDQQAS